MEPLPLQCEAHYYDDFLSAEQADALFAEIVEQFDVTDKRIQMFDGSEYIHETGIYMFCDPQLTGFEYLPEVWGARSSWPAALADVRDKVAEKIGGHFQVARCLYYRDGSEGLAFHCDPPAYGDTSAIASLSLGAEREFIFRRKDNHNEQLSLKLSSGSLVFMGRGCQENYEHGVPYDANCQRPRLNISFRKFGFDQ